MSAGTPARVVALLALLMLGGCANPAYDRSQRDARRAELECQAKGGVYVSVSSSKTCLAVDSIIPPTGPREGAATGEVPQ